MTQHALAHRAGTSKQQVSTYERGEKTPNVPTLYRLAAALGTIMDNLVDIDDDIVIEPDPDED